jgi:hypothetical protein
MKSLALGFLVSVIFFSVPAFAMGEKVSAQQPSSSETTTANGDSVWVMRPDELKHANIHVLDSKKNASLKMHSQLCGLPTGTSNAYLISRSDLPRALTLGYQQAK